MEQDLGYRKIQRTGRGSYITSLPKEWVQTLGLHKGSEIAFKVTDESALLLVPRTIIEGRKEDAAKEHLLSLSQTEDLRSVCRKIISLYVVSAHLIYIRVKEGNIDPKLRDAINNTVRNTLLGSEIIEESANRITIQVLINHPDFSIEQALRRMALLDAARYD